jgi:DNA-directed RNA polymerase subunit RPC12/RpoP
MPPPKQPSSPPPLPPAPGAAQPVQTLEPVESRPPPTGRKFPCAKCGARLDFDPSLRGLTCPYCGYHEAINPSAHKVEERDWEEYWRNQKNEEKPLAGRSTQVTCTGCGAVVLLEDKLVTDRCPYCATALENKPEQAKAMIQPEGILPFAIIQRQAIDAFNRWIKSLWFAPNDLKQFANLGKLTGVYIPYWTYDAMTYTHYTGSRGDDYTVAETYTVTNAKGEQETQTRMVTHTRWTYVSGEVRHFFDDVLICGSKSLPPGLVSQLTGWNLSRLEEYRPEFLSGFQTERYLVGLKEGFDLAKAIMAAEVRRLCCRNIGGDHQQLDSVQTQYVGVTFKHILLPVWIAAYRYREQTHRILVNGQTGAVVGTRPYSWVKIALLVLGILLAVLLGFLLFSAFAGSGGFVGTH